MQPQLPIEVEEHTGIWSTDGLPMIYVPRHFFVNNHVEAEAAIGREAYAQSLYKAGHRSAYFWCEQESRTHGLRGLAVYEHYLKRLSQRGWGLFSFEEVNAAAGHARILLSHSVFVLAQGTAGVPVRRDKVCYLFAGWFSGAMDWVGHDAGKTWKTHSEETRCAAEQLSPGRPKTVAPPLGGGAEGARGPTCLHEHCVFSVTPISA